MPNEFLKPKVIVSTALGLLQRRIVLPGLVWADAVASWDGAEGDTITIRVPARAKARRRALRSGGAITVDQLRETPVPVKLTDEVYQATGVSNVELTLDIGDFGAQVLMPQTRAVAEDLEDMIATAMIAAPYTKTLTVNVTAPEDTITDAREILNDADVDRDERYAVLGSAMETAYLKSEALKKVSNSGSDSALRRAEIGDLSGVRVFGSNAIPANVGFVFHRSAFVLGIRAPIVPDGVSFGQSETYEDMAMTWLRDYDASTLADRSVVTTFAGVSTVIDGEPTAPGGPATFVRAVKLTMPTTP